MGEDRLTANLLKGSSKMLLRFTLKEIEAGGWVIDRHLCSEFLNYAYFYYGSSPLRFLLHMHKLTK